MEDRHTIVVRARDRTHADGLPSHSLSATQTRNVVRVVGVVSRRGHRRTRETRTRFVHRKNERAQVVVRPHLIISRSDFWLANVPRTYETTKIVYDSFRGRNASQCWLFRYHLSIRAAAVTATLIVDSTNRSEAKNCDRLIAYFLR